MQKPAAVGQGTEDAGLASLEDELGRLDFEEGEEEEDENQEEGEDDEELQAKSTPPKIVEVTSKTSGCRATERWVQVPNNIPAPTPAPSSCKFSRTEANSKASVLVRSHCAVVSY